MTALVHGDSKVPDRVQPTLLDLNSLYLADETAWLDATAELVRTGQLDQVDSSTLAEYLEDMARRDRREVASRLAILIAHLLKWQHRPDQRSASWNGTIELQRQELADLLDSGVLHNHAEEVFEKAYANGRRQASAESGLQLATFPEECPYSLDTALSEPLT